MFKREVTSKREEINYGTCLGKFIKQLEIMQYTYIFPICKNLEQYNIQNEKSKLLIKDLHNIFPFV